MKDELLLKISLLTAWIGLFALFIILQSNEIKVYTIEELDMLEDNEKVAVIGQVRNLNENERAVSFDISEYKIVSQRGIMFKRNNESSGISAGDFVKIKGSWYENRIIIDDIEKIEEIENS
ncbi:MAG: hypothetical protein ACMXX5_00825 [Candidatus Woesearchaeota archaeon]